MHLLREDAFIAATHEAAAAADEAHEAVNDLMAAVVRMERRLQELGDMLHDAAQNDHDETDTARLLQAAQRVYAAHAAIKEPR